MYENFTRGSYALRIMTELAMCNPEEFVSIRYLSEKQGLSLKYLEQIVGLLNKAGLLTVARGANGDTNSHENPKIILSAKFCAARKATSHP